jgi:hypothetical protein
MASAAPTIQRAPPADAALDFGALRSEGLGIARAASSDIWTDYNAHDPGVTILEQLCYALTESAYRIGFPAEDLLADPAGGIAGVGSVLYRPWRILPCEPVTLNDYRRLLIDRVEGLANVWFDPVATADGAPSGLYDIRLYAAPHLPGLRGERRRHERIVEHARRVFLRHRALCEDIGSIERLEALPVSIEACIDVDPASRPEEVMAALIQQLACYLAPEPRRSPAAPLIAKGATLADLLEGPLPANGFIADAALAPRRTQVTEAELRQQAAAVPGVLAVRTLRLLVPEQVTLGDCYLSLQLDLESDPIQIFVGGAPCEIARGEVRRRLKALWEQHRGCYRILPELRRLFPPPGGQPRPPGNYVPVSSQFPAVYGIGPGGLSRDAPPARQAQAKQLLGYLALFERLNVDLLERLAHLPLLISAEPPDEDAFETPLAQVIPSLAALLIDEGPDPEKVDGRSAIPLPQQDRLLDFLLALYGENPGPFLPFRAGRGEEVRLHQVLPVKRALLTHLVAAGNGRGRGFDYRARRWRRHCAGVELRSRIMLGAESHGERRRRPRLSIVEHVLLRPRCSPQGGGPDPMTITAVIHLPEEAAKLLDRAAIVAMVRANTAVHIALQTCFVDRSEWVEFRRLHKLWRRAMRDELPEVVDWISNDLRSLFARWAPEQ